MDTKNPTMISFADYVALWTHHEERAAGVREQMIVTLTWLHGLLVTLGTTISLWFLKQPDIVYLKPSIVLAMSIAGLLLAILSIVLVNDFRRHMHNNYNRSKGIREICGTLHATLNQISAKAKEIEGRNEN
jgi:hypothetical protein